MKIKTSFMMAILASLFTLSSQAVVIDIDTTLDGNQEVPPTMTTATGVANLIFDTDTNLVDFSLSVTGLSLADITFPSGGLAFSGVGPVHLHDGVAGTNGPIILPFADQAFYSATLTGFDLQATQLMAPAGFEQLLAAGSVYINVHSLDFGSGEIRGQLSSAVPEPSTYALFGLAGLGLLLRRRKTARA